MFESASLKLERADQHIADLRIACDAFTSHRHNFHFRQDADSNSMIIDVTLNEPVPSSVSLIAGDAIHNLRTTLDHATWELIGLDGGEKNRWLTFPTARLRRDHEAACRGIKKCRTDTIEFLIAFAAYPGGGGEKLYGLKLLDDVDKHQVLTPVLSITEIKNAKVLDKNGQIVATFEGNRLTMGPDGRARLGIFAPDLTFVWDEHPEPSVEILFGNVEFFQCAPLVATLVHLRESVSDALGQFREFVDART